MNPFAPTGSVLGTTVNVMAASSARQLIAQTIAKTTRLNFPAILVWPVRYRVLPHAQKMERVCGADGRIIPRPSFRCGRGEDVTPVHRAGEHFVCAGLHGVKAC